MVAAGAAVWHADREPTVLAIWDQLRKVEALPVLIYLFVGGPRAAKLSAELTGHVLVAYYMRDDEMTLFHGRNQVALYAWHRDQLWTMNAEQFAKLERESNGLAGLS